MLLVVEGRLTKDIYLNVINVDIIMQKFINRFVLLIAFSCVSASLLISCGQSTKKEDATEQQHAADSTESAGNEHPEGEHPAGEHPTESEKD